ncbi:carotenoid 9,10(9',10')-cleavage dioxygenase-like isoform X3 [Dendrobium catenatum]|uniref:carotenoid 9,10(9',10')-cleavage dioxygenase-like isoform X3 n=1 Tax=Dendrobium catenatum TaxID=906689 RepID=UPI0010A073B2|nr:carotenoid 9,10(9',10')-cleavage dioxygenase-like isoform X3 [Dendrobium catenatum]
MAAVSSSFHFCSSARRAPINSISLKLAQLASSFTQPLLRALQRGPARIDMAGVIKKTSGRLLDAFVDFAFHFEDQPWLPSQSNFMPVDEIEEAVIISNIEGEIPHDFPEGVYIRNGSNPLFGALQSGSSVLGLCSETWVEGEGMLHALSFSRATPAAVSVGSGGAWTLSYKNRFVESKTFQLERSRNHPAFLPLIEGDAPAVLASFLLNKLRFGKMAKDLSNTNVLEFSGKVFAVAENHMPLEIDLLSLETIGDWDLSGAWDRPFMAHPKKAPGGELVFVGADGKKPFLVLVDGKELKHKVDLKLERGIVCHDIGVTERYNIILDMPLTFDIVRLMKGGPLLKYEKESYARIGVMPRYGDSDSIKWFDVEPYCTLHLVNCYEDGDEVVVRGGRSRGSIIPGPDLGRNKCQWFSSGFKLKLAGEDCDGNPNEGLLNFRLHEWRLNMKNGSVRNRYLTGSDLSIEFYMCNDLFVGLHNQYAYAQVVDSVASSICALPKYGGLMKLYLDEKDSTTMQQENDNGGSVKVERHPLGANEFCSGAAFVSKLGGVQEDDGWIISFVHNEHTNTSQVHIIDAKNFKDDPVAKIILPKRVPYGFHGAFIPMPNRL